MNFLNDLAGRRRFGMKPGLETIRALLAALGNPERGIAAVHVAGTNGKGATVALIDSALRAAGFETGRYISPHLVRLNERFAVRGQEASDSSLEAAAAEVEPAARALEAKGGEVTFFEFLTAMAFALFRKEGIKLAVLETGLGGRLDATNVCLPLVSVITRIGLDHCAWLGDTVEKIAAEKAGIIKPGRPVVCGAMPDGAREVIRRTAAERGSLFIDVPETVSVTASKRALDGQTLRIATADRQLKPIRLPLAGPFQVENAATAAAALDAIATCGLAVPDEAIVSGFETVRWPGRFQLLEKDPPVILDGGHNPPAAAAIREALAATGKAPVGLIVGSCEDKDTETFLRTLAPAVKRAWAVPIPNPRGRRPLDLVGLLGLAGIPNAAACASLEDALAAARPWARDQKGRILICGSLFLAGEALKPGSARLDPSELLARA